MTAVTVRIPTPLRKFTGGAKEVPASGATVGEVLADLVGKHTGLKATLFDDGGQLRNFVNIFVGATDSRTTGGLASPVAAGQALSIVPAVAGGNR